MDWDSVEGAPPEVARVLDDWFSDAAEPGAPGGDDVRLRAALEALRKDAPRTVAALLEAGQDVEPCEGDDEALVDHAPRPAPQER
jgi:hypothetical protein